jgi:CBS domain-containing protein
MRAIDVMVRDVKTVKPDANVAEAVKLLVKHDISALPVVDDDGTLVGVLSEADLIHRVELDTEVHHPWWIEAVVGSTTLAEEFAKSHGKKVSEVMTTNVVSAAEESTLSEIAALMEHKRIKRVPIVKDGKLVGMVSRSNLVQALASSLAQTVNRHHEYAGEAHARDREIRHGVLDRLREQPWTGFGDRNITVSEGVVHVWGLVGSEQEHKALLALVEEVPGVARVSDEMIASYK